MISWVGFMMRSTKTACSILWRSRARPRNGVCYSGGIVGENSGTVSGCLFANGVSTIVEAIANNTREGTCTKCYRSYAVEASGGLAANEAYLNQKTFYTEMLGWDETYWDLSALNFASGVYPKLHLQ